MSAECSDSARRHCMGGWLRPLGQLNKVDKNKGTDGPCHSAKVHSDHEALSRAGQCDRRGKKGAKRCPLLRNRGDSVLSSAGWTWLEPARSFLFRSFTPFKPLQPALWHNCVFVKNRCALGAEFSSCLIATQGKGNKAHVTDTYTWHFSSWISPQAWGFDGVNEAHFSYLLDSGTMEKSFMRMKDHMSPLLNK